MRSIAKLMKDWQFTGPNGVTTAVELPHTWNARDGQDGGNDYWRGCCTYCTRFAAPVYDPAQQQVWLQFEGVNASAAVLLNGQQLCTHDGGYSTFRAEVTELLQAENQLTVRVDNSVNDRVYPQKADFTFYGGIYRDVSLLVVNKNHIALGHFGDTGVKITQNTGGKHAAHGTAFQHKTRFHICSPLLCAGAQMPDTPYINYSILESVKSTRAENL